MKKIYLKFFGVLLLILSISIPKTTVAVSDSLIATNSLWKYLDNGSNQGTAWKATAFNDASWASGNAELGYGDGDEATVVSYGNNASNKYITTYFRKSFTVANASNYTSLTFGIVRDDGAIIYLNGTEVYRTNMPTGSVNFKTKASTDITGTNESNFIYFTIASTLLVSGTNNVSVEIHQFDKTSPDISFKLNLAALQVSCFTSTGLNANNITTNSATLNWTTVSGAVGYNVRYRIIGAPSWTTTTSATNSLNVSSLSPASNYEWQVQTDCGSSNLSTFSASSNFTTLTPPCNVPAGLSTTNITASSATLSWTTVSGAVGYNVRYRIVGAPSWTTTTSATSSVNVSSLSPASNYEWQVQTDCGSANLSAFSASSNFTTAAAPPACNTPAGLTSHSITSTSAVVTWNAVSGALSYNLRYRINGGPVWTTVSATSTSVDVAGLSPGTSYECQVQTVCSAGSSAFTSSVTFTTQSASTFDTLIASGALWKYYDFGLNLGTNWRSSGYSDASWAQGPSQLGYGDGDEATTVSYGSDPNNKYITTYFRKSFTLSNAGAYISLILNIVRDDGAVVYLNGTEIYRSNLPTGTIAYNTLASAAISGTDESAWYSASVNPSLLVTGNNVIAVEMHQNSITSSDISFNFRLLGSRVPVITRGPYLQTLTPASVIVRWQTSVATGSRVRCGLSPSNYAMNFYDAASVTDHAMLVNGLSAATQYYYTVENQTYVLEATANNYFVTAPVTETVAPVRIWAIGDFGNGSTSQAAVRDAYMNYTGATYTNLWLWLGDNAYENGLETEWQTNVFNMYPNQFKNMPLYPSIGNHDYANIGYQSSSAMGTNFPYFRIVSVPTAAEAGGIASGTEKYYSFNYANIHFICLDTYGALNNPGSPMYNWLVADLVDNRQRWVVVYFHHPPYTQGSHDSNTESALINVRQNLVPVLEDYGVDLVLSGHSHANERTSLIRGHYGLANTFNSSMIVQGGSGAQPNPYVKTPPYYGTVYAVCGTGGKLSSTTEAGWPMQCMYFSNSSVNASLVIDVNGDQLDCKYLSSAGNIIDRFSIVKSGARTASGNGEDESERLEVHPNPFSHATTISYFLDSEKQVSLELHNVLGEKVYAFTAGNEMQKSGKHEYEFSARAAGLEAGIYFVKLVTGDKTTVSRVVLVR
jgi:hypothetical protein